ncbi:hypothetical protein JTB14_020679 [Gonioctena quinquepunctata]|nr:hypothetical protein JTB14_020679 [Gonioctena quinquepunctata]
MMIIMMAYSAGTSKPLFFRQANIWQGRLREHKINVSLIQEPRAVQGRVKVMGQAGSTLYYSTSEDKPRICIHARYSATKLLPQRVKNQWKESTSEIVVRSAYFPHEIENPLQIVISSKIREKLGILLLMGCDANYHHTSNCWYRNPRFN